MCWGCGLAASCAIGGGGGGAKLGTTHTSLPNQMLPDSIGLFTPYPYTMYLFVAVLVVRRAQATWCRMAFVYFQGDKEMALF